MSIATDLVEAPATTAAFGGLLSVATVVPTTRGLTVEYQPEACGPALTDVDRCNPPAADWTFAVDSALGATLTVPDGPFEENLTIDWGDDGVPADPDTPDGEFVVVNATDDPTGPVTAEHTYADGGTYEVSITGAGFSRTFTVTVHDGRAGSWASDDKVFDGVGLITGTPFTVYKGIECDLFDTVGAQARARRGLELGEGRAVESVVWSTLLANSGAVDLTPSGGAVTMKAGLGILEGYAGEAYGSRAILHIPRSLIPLLSDLEREGDHLETIQGSLIANGAGYTSNTGPTGQVAAAGKAWMYASGMVVLHRTEISEHSAPVMQDNRYQALAERIYVPTVECFIAAVLVSLAGV